MDQTFDAHRLEALAEAGADWVRLHVLTAPVLLQFLLLIVSFIVAGLLSRSLRPIVERWLSRRAMHGRGARLLETLPSLLRPALFLALIWLVVGVMRQLAPPGDSYLLGVVASLVTAWIVITLSSALIRNAVLARAVALFAWTVAALNITGLLQPTIAALDAVALKLGETRLSLLDLVSGALALAVLLWLALAFSRLLEARIRSVPDLTPSVQVLLANLLKVTLLVFAVVIALNTVGIDLTVLAVFSGAVGVGVGFGLQKVVSNLISGVILLLDKSIKPGDVIEVGDTFGWINALGARFVSVVTRDGKEYLIPNEDLITNRVINWSYTNTLVRLEIKIGIAYSSDVRVARRIIAEAAANSPRVLADPQPVCHLYGFGDSSVDLLLRFWISDPAAGVVNIKSDVLQAVWDAFKEHGIEIPFPHRRIILPGTIRVETSGPG